MKLKVTMMSLIWLGFMYANYYVMGFIVGTE